MSNLEKPSTRLVAGTSSYLIDLLRSGAISPENFTHLCTIFYINDIFLHKIFVSIFGFQTPRLIRL